MDFELALKYIKKYIHLNDEKEYDGIIVKRLASSNTIGHSKIGKQTHIAITGEQMDMFPYIAPYRYLDCDYSDKDDSVKRFFILQIKMNLYKSNVEALEGNIVFDSGVQEKTVHMSVWRRRDEQNQQIQLSAINLDDKDCIEFRKLIHTNDYMIILKLKNELEYDLVAIRSEWIKDDNPWKIMNNKFIKSNTTTKVSTDSIYEILKNAENKICNFSSNILLYGVPGCGKSYFVEQKYETQVTNIQCKVRVVFHPDYTYSDFVGQIMPYLEIKNEDNGETEEKLTYKFIPGSFTRIMKVAKENPNEKCLLIIEELNRGNAPAIFGEIFQLLDRDVNGYSKYAIYNSDISKELYGKNNPNEPIKLPPNLTIIATMNTSDQNVFTMDTAFQRRWQMRHIPNRFYGESINEATQAHVAKHIPASKISWGVFATTVNSKMGKASLGFAGTEDKSLGVYFATDKDLDDKEVFAEKVLKYLWDDAFKMARNELFIDREKSLSDVLESFEEAKGDPLKAVLLDAIYVEMLEKQRKIDDTNADEVDVGDNE